MNALPATTRATRTASTGNVDYLAALTGARSRACASPTAPDLGVFPVDPRVAEVVRRGGRGVRGGRRARRGGQAGDQARLAQELSDSGAGSSSRAQSSRSSASRESGIDLLGEHRDDFPPEFLHWVDNGREHERRRAARATRRSAPRSTTPCRACSTTTTCSSRRRWPAAGRRTPPTATRSGRPRSMARRSIR